MMTRYRVALDDRQLDTVASGIIIRDIAYTAPAEQHAASALSARNGMHVQNTTFGTSSVTVSFEIHEADVKKRQDVCRKIQAWAARGGWLTTNDKAGLRLRVRCSTLPAINSAMRWTERLSMVFTAYEQPLWEDVYPTRVVSKESGAPKMLYVDGTADRTVVDVVVENTGDEEINSLSVFADSSYIELQNLTLAAGAKLEIGHDENDLLFIRADGVSHMNKRTAESSDDLVILCGVNTAVSFICEGEAKATFTARGRCV